MKQLSIVIVVEDDVDILNNEKLQEFTDSLYDRGSPKHVFITQKPYNEIK